MPQEYILVTQEYILVSQGYSCDTRIYSCDTGIYSCDTRIGGLGGASPACPTPWNREIDFDSFLRTGEAKLRGRVRDMPPPRWACGCGEFLRLAGCFSKVFAFIRMGFKWCCIDVFVFWCLFVAMHVGFKRLAPVNTVICMVLNGFDKYCCYLHGF